MSESGEERRQQSGNAQDEQELASKQLKIQSKRFYIDVKENKRGRFIKLAEVGVGGRKNRILMSMQVASDFKQQLDTFCMINSDMGPIHGTSITTSPPQASSASISTPTDANSQPLKGNKRGESKRTISTNDQDGLIKSETLNSVVDRKRYYLDLKENQRGRFLRVSMVLNSGQRAQIAIPAQGLIEFKDELQKLLDQYSLGTSELTPSVGTEEVVGVVTVVNPTVNTSSNGTQQQQQTSSTHEEDKRVVVSDADLPESKSLRADGKMFYFDCGSNQRGVFLKISEVRQNRYRTSITIPEKYLDQFQKLCLEYSEKTSLTAASATSVAATQEEITSEQQ